MKQTSINKENPLVKYQRDLTKENFGKRINNWKLIANKCGMPLQTIISIARLTYDGVLRMSLGSYLKIKNGIGVDMLSFGKDDKEE